MGHSLLGTLRKTKQWKDVIALITNGGSAAEVAEKIVVASEKAFDAVENDETFKKVMAYLVQLAQAGRADDPVAALNQLGVSIDESTTPLDISLSVQTSLDEQTRFSNNDSDFGEQAVNALTSTMTEYLQDNQLQLFDPGKARTLSPLVKLSSPAEFGKFGARFFANLTDASLQYFLSKDLGTHVGEGKRFPTMNEAGQFSDALRTHCQESSEITRQYCEGWLGKQFRDTGGAPIDPKKAGHFGWYGINKMRSEITGHYERYDCGA